VQQPGKEFRMTSAPLDPPFRAEHIGSLLRPPALMAAREAHAAGRLDRAGLRAAEDAAIAEAVAYQQKMGLSSITDGEFRRDTYSSSFTTDVFEGVKMGTTGDRSWSYANTRGTTVEGRLPLVVARLEWPGPVNVANFDYLASLAPKGLIKITLPGPCYIHYRSGREHISPNVYPDLDNFWQDIVVAYEKEMAALHESGCRYIQLDETSIAKLGDPKIRDGLAKRGDDWRDLLALYTDVINDIVARAPKGMSVGMHLCRGNKSSSWQAEAGYDDVAAALFRKLAIRYYFLEFDSPRAGTFEPLAEVPDDKAVILGLISTKTTELEDRDAILRRIEEASRFVPVERLGISPQCGFASSPVGNASSTESQDAKLRLVVDIAREVWGYRPAAA
jgi:5-methyltetrahydropteroyltriglutamate--homocysteine methyltransferase